MFDVELLNYTLEKCFNKIKSLNRFLTYLTTLMLSKNRLWLQ